MPIFITKIEVVDTGPNGQRFLRIPKDESVRAVACGDSVPNQHFKTETIDIRTFRDGRGRHLELGWCEDLDKLFNLPLTAFDDQEGAIHTLHDDIQNAARINADLIRKLDNSKSENERIQGLFDLLESASKKNIKEVKSLKDQTVWYHLKGMFKAKRMFKDY